MFPGFGAGGYLTAPDDAEAPFPACLFRFAESGQGIMIRQGDGRQAKVVGAGHQRGGAVGAVRGGRVGMKIDEAPVHVFL